jgi:hypothetical protein
MITIVGASGWHVRVPYQDDICTALQRARQDAYDRGEFYRQEPNELARSMSEQEYVAWGVAQSEGLVPEVEGWEPTWDEYRDEWRAAQVNVTGPDSLLDAQPFSGTHSIIDMTQIAEEPDYNVVAAVPADELLRLFGTARPSAAEIEAAILQGSLRGFARWHGMFLIAFTDDQPSEIFFVGYSGD